MSLFSLNIIGHYWYRYEEISVIGTLAMLSVLVFFLIIHKVVSNKPLRYPNHENVELEQYTFAFNDTNVKVKRVSGFTKSVLFCLSAIIICTPLDKLMRTDIYYYLYSPWDWMLW